VGMTETSGRRNANNNQMKLRDKKTYGIGSPVGNCMSKLGRRKEKAHEKKIEARLGALRRLPRWRRWGTDDFGSSGGCGLST